MKAVWIEEEVAENHLSLFSDLVTSCRTLSILYDCVNGCTAIKVNYCINAMFVHLISHLLRTGPPSARYKQSASLPLLVFQLRHALPSTRKIKISV